MSTYTIADLVDLVEDREAEQAPGSETMLLGSFVMAYDYTQRLREERGDEPVTDEEYQSWVETYAEQARMV